MTTTSVPEPLPEPRPGAPTPPIALAGDAADARARLAMDRVEVPAEVLGRLTNACATVTDDRATVAEASRDWWPLAMVWATEGAVAGLGSVVCRPSTVEEVPEVVEAAPEPPVYVRVVEGLDEGTIFPFDRGRLVIGRGDSEIVLDDLPRIPLYQPALNSAVNGADGYEFWFHRQLDIRSLKTVDS